LKVINFDQTFEGLKLNITASPAKTLSVGVGVRDAPALPPGS
jgi:hypothetical protein